MVGALKMALEVVLLARWLVTLFAAKYESTVVDEARFSVWFWQMEGNLPPGLVERPSLN
jgi:hypothetical protein